MHFSRITIFLVMCLLLSISTVFAEPTEVRFLTIDQYNVAKEQVIALDVRSDNSRQRSKLILPGAKWIDPYSGQALKDFLGTADKSKSYVIFCSCTDDNYSIRTAQILAKNGFDLVFVLQGGWDAIINSGMETVPLN